MATTANVEKLKCGLDFEVLPKTVLDAVNITTQLSLKYLWVDRLCIIQDDLSDWARESSNMWDIFANAVVTISADRSPSVTSGILYDQRFANWPKKEIQVQDLKAVVQPKMPHEFAMQDRHTLQRVAPPAPIAYRAWCL